MAAVVLLAFAIGASARFLPHSLAYITALKDAQEHGPELVDTGASYGVRGCKRLKPGRVACRVYAANDTLDHFDDDARAIYKHKRCTWTVVSHFRGRTRLVYYFRKKTRCRTHFNDSSFG